MCIFHITLEIVPGAESETKSLTQSMNKQVSGEGTRASGIQQWEHRINTGWWWRGWRSTVLPLWSLHSPERPTCCFPGLLRSSLFTWWIVGERANCRMWASSRWSRSRNVSLLLSLPFLLSFFSNTGGLHLKCPGLLSMCLERSLPGLQEENTLTKAVGQLC